ncbi:MAG TPA: SDR family oxidoreductase [Beijerinckiaceae bacterium]|nr:SDR family oxidoreductase [Beijerinckiaceae bacterium]
MAIISGGGGEIGGAVARCFAREGARVLVTDVSPDKAEAIAAEIEEAGGKAAALAVDVGDPAQCEAAARQAVTQFGKLTVLLNAAVAPTPDGNVEQLSLADWSEALAINLTGYFLMCKYAVPAMRAAGRGSIVNIASSHGHIAMRRRPAYCSTKAAIHHFTRVLALDYGAENIRANTISPGPIDTARILHRYGTREKANAARGPTQVLGRTGSVDEVAAAALFLACDESAFVTGADLRVDGGQTIWKS